MDYLPKTLQEKPLPTAGCPNPTIPLEVALRPYPYACWCFGLKCPAPSSPWPAQSLLNSLLSGIAPVECSCAGYKAHPALLPQKHQTRSYQGTKAPLFTIRLCLRMKDRSQVHLYIKFQYEKIQVTHVCACSQRTLLCKYTLIAPLELPRGYFFRNPQRLMVVALTHYVASQPTS